MMTANKITKIGSMTFLFFTLCLGACDQNAANKTLGNSKDTTSVFKAGGPPIRDTSTVSKDRRDSSNATSKSSSAKGNADPSGHKLN